MPLIGVSQCDTTYNQKVKPSINKEQAPNAFGGPFMHAAERKPNGYNKFYNDNDELWQEGCFKNSRLWDGKLYVYDRDENLVKIKVFKNGFYCADEQLPE